MLYISEDSIIDSNEKYIAYWDRFCPHMIALHFLNESMWKTYEQAIAEKFSIRYTHREEAYLMSKKQYEKFKMEITK